MPTLIHFGFDDCFRIQVLAHDHYSVLDCRSIAQLYAALVQDESRVDAVIVTEGDEFTVEEITTLVRANSNAPVIVFQTAGKFSDCSGIDLVISALTNPHNWLKQIAELIEQSRALLRRKPVRKALPQAMKTYGMAA